MGGEIAVESEVGKGSTFSFELHLRVVNEAKTARDAVSEPALPNLSDKPRSLRLLIAEDNPINQKVLMHMLKRRQHEIDIASNGDEAVELARRTVYDLIFMDCQMPVMDGLAATRCIRADAGPNQETPIIAVTANAFEEDHNRCLAAGMNDYISKPITQAQLDAAIEKWSAEVVCS